MKEEILRRQDIFKSFIEKEAYNSTPTLGDIQSMVDNIMTLYKADIQYAVECVLKEYRDAFEKAGIDFHGNIIK